MLSTPDYGHIKNFIYIASHYLSLGHEVSIVSSDFHPALQTTSGVSTIKAPVEFWYSKLLLQKRRYFFSMMLPTTKKSAVAECLVKLKEFEERVNMLEYDLILIDRFVSHLILIYPDIADRFIILNTMMTCYRSNRTPPLNTALQPDNRFFQIRLKYLWTKNRLREKLIQWRRYSIDPWSMITEIARIRGAHIDYKGIVNGYGSSIHRGIINVPEYCTGYRAFDIYGEKPIKPNRYLGISQMYPRKTIETDFKLSKAVKAAKASGKKIILIGFGTIHGTSSTAVSYTVNLIVEVLRHESNWLAVIAGAKSWFDCVDIQNINNIYVSNFVPQADLLFYSDLFVCHGGLSSVMEAVDSCTPIIVIPFSSSSDMLGNAAKVEFHKIGIYLKRSELSVDLLRESMNYLLHNECVNIKLIELKKQCILEKNHSAKMIQSLLECVS